MTDMLVDQQNANVLALAGKVVKGVLEDGVIRLGVDDEEVALRVGGGRDVLRLSGPWA